TLLLYTDGLVERREEDLTVGLERLRHHASAAARRPLEAFCDDLLDGLADAGGDDDVAMVAVRPPASSAGDRDHRDGGVHEDHGGPDR
ncbi:SpoIIE family protein phosphatase, partial [Streptomyces viridosporus]|uniref:SpoIIE family protein phosphatase n=1 Tax=Streptomyces viridosporus TaxID=67581 RepID=UPI00135A0C16